MHRTTSAITLVLAGAFVASCDNNDMHRAVYSSKEACLKDWNSEKDCQQSTAHSGGFFYYGPWYNRSSPFWGRGGGASTGIVSQGGGSVSSAAESAHFGGFGESAGAHGSAGE
jgi:hypothetical protein